MASNMVKECILSPKECIDLVVCFFSKEFSRFKLNKREHYMGYWIIEYINEKDKVIINFDGDIGGHFYVYITITGTKYPLWMFDRSVNQTTFSTRDNILFQLNVLNIFFRPCWCLSAAMPTKNNLLTTALLMKNSNKNES